MKSLNYRIINTEKKLEGNTYCEILNKYNLEQSKNHKIIKEHFVEENGPDFFASISDLNDEFKSINFDWGKEESLCYLVIKGLVKKGILKTI